MALKERAGLFKPTKGVVKVCKETERWFNRMLANTGGNLSRCPGRNNIKLYAIHANTNMVYVPQGRFQEM